MDFIKLIKLPFTIVKLSRLTQKSIFKGNARRSLFNALVVSYIRTTFFKDQKKIKIKLFDYTVNAFNYYSFQSLLIEIFISKPYYFRSAKTDPFILDCGANIGMATLFFKKLYPDAVICCFEPNPETFKLLEKNIRENNLSNVSAYNYALANSENKASFYTGNPSKPIALGNVTCSLLDSRGGPVKVEVQCAKLSPYINRNVDILKMDIEGAEQQVLEDLYQANSLKYLNCCLIEYHHNIKDEKGELGKFLSRFEEAGFEYSISGWYGNVGDMQDVFLYVYRNNYNIHG